MFATRRMSKRSLLVSPLWEPHRQTRTRATFIESKISFVSVFMRIPRCSENYTVGPVVNGLVVHQDLFQGRPGSAAKVLGR